MMRRQLTAIAVSCAAASVALLGLPGPAAAAAAPHAVALSASWGAQGGDPQSGGVPTLNAGASQPMRYTIGVSGVPAAGVSGGRLSLVFPQAALSAAHVTAATLAADLKARYGPADDIPATSLAWTAAADGSLRLDTPVNLPAGTLKPGIGYWFTASATLPAAALTGELELTDAQGTVLAERAQSLRLARGGRDVDADGHDDLLVRDKSGNLFLYRGTGKASPLFQSRIALPWSFPQTGYSGFTVTGANPADGLPMAVARCSASKCGTTGLLEAFLPSYPVTGHPQAVGGAYQGTAWKYYTAETGVGDVTGDGRADLLSRDSAGVLWISPGNTGMDQPFHARVEVGSGWNQYDRIVGTGDLTGDGHADLVVRDTAGVLWLCRGTGSASSPFLARTRIGSGWGQFDALAGPGEITGDGHPDLVARDTAGVLWLYQGTGNATTPFLPKVRIGSGWSQFSELF